MALGADYRGAGFGGGVGWGARPALLIVDMCKAYLQRGSPLFLETGGAVRDAIVPVAAAARAAGAPVIFTRVEYAHPADGGLFRRKIAALACFDSGNPLADFDPALLPEAGDMVLTKQFPSAFFGTPLPGLLTAQGVDTLLITGVSTSGCIRATAVDALCHGFAPQVITDCVGDRTPEIQAANLLDLEAKTADLLDSAAAIARLKP
jgi:nicotinamidase-related amidase